MRIKIKESSGKKFSIVIPTGLIFNPVVATLLCGVANRAIDENTEDSNNIELTPKQMRILFKAIRVAAKQLKKDKLPLVEVVSADGEEVLIDL